MSASVADTCPCGAEFAVKAEVSGTAEKRHTAWLSAHAPCRAAWVALPNESADEARRIVHFPHQS